MSTLIQDLQTTKENLAEFHDVTVRVLNHMPNVISETIHSRGYRLCTDIVLSPYEGVRSDTQNVHANEIIVSSKTTSKDRMGKIFIDKLLLQKFSEHDTLKVVGIFLNDVQRKKQSSGKWTISYTLVAGLFMVYTQFLTEMEGVYFIDPPPNAFKSPWNKHIFPFSQLIIDDIGEMLSVAE